MNLQPIGIETQIEDLLLGQSEKDKKSVQEKISHVVKNIKRVIKVNGKKVYNPVVVGEDIRYNFIKCPEEWEHSLSDGERMYYYPIQYAKIELI